MNPTRGKSGVFLFFCSLIISGSAGAGWLDGVVKGVAETVAREKVNEVTQQTADPVAAAQQQQMTQQAIQALQNAQPANAQMGQAMQGMQAQMAAQQAIANQSANYNAANQNLMAVQQGMTAVQAIGQMPSGGQKAIGANAALGAAAALLGGAGATAPSVPPAPQPAFHFANGVIGDFDQDGQVSTAEYEAYRQQVVSGAAAGNAVVQPGQPQGGAAGLINGVVGGFLGR